MEIMNYEDKNKEQNKLRKNNTMHFYSDIWRRDFEHIYPTM